MKKQTAITTLSLNKFKIASISNFGKSKILGGTNGFGDDTDDTITDGIKKESKVVDDNTRCTERK